MSEQQAQPGFPKFWFEGNLIWGWVSTPLNLKHIYEMYDGTLTPNEVLDLSKNSPHTDEYDKFGLRAECNGDVTLRAFLKQKGVSDAEMGI